MDGFLDYLGKILTIIFANIATLFVLGFMIFGVTYLFSSKPMIAGLPKHVVLYHDFSKSFDENDQDDTLFDLNFSKASSLSRLIDTLYSGAKDERVLGFVGRLDTCSLGLAQIEELRAALHHFTQAGKFAKVYAASLGEGTNGTPAYYLATAFQDIWVQPSGLISPIGFMAEHYFYKGLMDRVGVKADFIKRKAYKSFPNQFTEDGYTPEQLDNIKAIFANLKEPVLQAIGTDRSLTGPALDTIFDNAPYMAHEALEAKLIDHVGYWDEFKHAIETETKDAKWIRLKKYVRPKSNPTTKFALIDINGVITSGESNHSPFSQSASAGSLTITKGISQAIDDPEIKALILHIDSPGGSMVGSDSIWREVKRAREKGKIVIASMSNTAASGGYYVAMGADKILALETTITGSIGTFMGKFDISGLLKTLSIKWGTVLEGKNADIWSGTQSFTQDQKDKLNKMSDAAYGDFVTKAADGRKMKGEDLEKKAQGRVWTGKEALAEGLIDGIGGLREAVEAAKEMTSLDPKTEVELVPYPKPKSLKDYFSDLLDDLQLTINRTDAILTQITQLFSLLKNEMHLGGSPL